MDRLWEVVPLLAAALLLAAVFRRPLLWLLRLAGRSLLWLGALFLLAGAGVTALGVNCFNALALGLLGLPGLGLLLGLRWLG